MSNALVPQRIVALRELVGSAVFVPCNQGVGGKGPIVGGWQHLTCEQMTSAHIAQCERPEYRIGVLSGQNSGGLCGCDCDDDGFADEMRRLNPWLARTLTTTCNRGLTFWIRMVGPYPAKKVDLFWRGVRVGEWRADGSISVIAGKDTQTGNPRTFITHAPARSVSFEVLCWPDGLEAGGGRLRKSWPFRCEGLSGEWSDGVAISARNGESPFPPRSQRDVERNDADQRLRSTSHARARSTSQNTDVLPEKERKRKRLYRQLVGQLSSLPKCRNELLVQAVPFLVHAIAEPLVREFLLKHFDECGKPCGWEAERSDHERSIVSLISGTLEHYSAKLNDRERDVYGALRDDLERAAFRIARDLSRRDDMKRDCPPGLFILAYGELAARLDCSNKCAESILKHRFTRELKVLAVETPGIRRSAGVQGKATRWRWKL